MDIFTEIKDEIIAVGDMLGTATERFAAHITHMAEKEAYSLAASSGVLDGLKAMRAKLDAMIAAIPAAPAIDPATGQPVHPPA